MSVNYEYEAMKAEYTGDNKYNIPEKLYAYYKANGISADKAESYKEKFANALIRGGFVDRMIPRGQNETVYNDLMVLLNGFGFDHNYSVDNKRKLLRELHDSVVSRLAEEEKPDATITSAPKNAVEPLQKFWAERGSYYTVPRTVFNNSKGSGNSTPGEGSGNNTKGKEGSENEFVNPNENANHNTKEGGRRNRRKTRRNRRSRRQTRRVQKHRK